MQESTIGAENITYIKKIGGNLFDVTRCNTLHHLNCQDLFDVTKIETILICNHFRPNGIPAKLSYVTCLFSLLRNALGEFPYVFLFAVCNEMCPQPFSIANQVERTGNTYVS